MIIDLKAYFENLPINEVRKRLYTARKIKDCMAEFIAEGWAEEAHFLTLRTHLEHRIAILEEIIRVSDETIKALKEG